MKKSFHLWSLILFIFLTLTVGTGEIAEAKKVKLLMITWRGMTEADNGFMARAKELGLALDITHHDLNQDKAKMGQLYRELKWTDYDYVYTYGTTASKAAQLSIAGKVPQLFTMVSYPVEAGMVKSLERSGNKVTGVSNNMPLRKQYDAVLKIKNLKKVGIFFNPIEENNSIAYDDFEKESKARGISITTYRTGSDIEQIRKDCEQIVKDYRAGKIDGIFLPSSSFFTSNASKFMPILAEGGVFSFTAIDKITAAGATVGVLFSYDKLGRLAADRLKELVEGKLKIEDAPTMIQENPDIQFNQLSASKTGLRLPASATFIK